MKIKFSRLWFMVTAFFILDLFLGPYLASHDVFGYTVENVKSSVDGDIHIAIFIAAMWLLEKVSPDDDDAQV